MVVELETNSGCVGTGWIGSLGFAPDLFSQFVESQGALYYCYWMHRAYADIPVHYRLRTDPYALIFFYSRPLDVAGASEELSELGWELYGLKRDSSELHNVYDNPAYADVREELNEQLVERKSELGDDDSQYPELVELKEEHW